MRYLVLVTALLISLGAENTVTRLRQVRPYPAWLAAALSPLPADLTPADGAALATAITNAVGGDTITLTADGRKYTGPFTLAAGKTSTVTIRSSAHASLPAEGTSRATSSTNLAIIECSASSNQKCVSTPTNGAANYKFWGIEFQQKAGTVNQIAMIMVGDNTEVNTSEVAENIEFSYCLARTTVGTARAWWLNGRNITVRDSSTETIRTAGQENQAILVAGGPGPFTITNNHLRALGEVIMVGGTTTGIFPGDFTITRNYLDPPQEYNPWNLAAFNTTDVQASAALPCSLSSTGATATCTAHGVPTDTFRVIKLTSGPQTGEMKTVARIDANTLQMYTAFSADQSGVSATVYTPYTGHKNTLEFKYLHGTTNLVEGNVLGGCWVMGQTGECLVLTVRTESGVLPTATIKNLTIQYNYFRQANQFLRIISPDDALPSGVGMDNVKIQHNVIELGYENSGPGTQAGSPTSAVRGILYNGVSPTLSGNTVWFNHNTLRSAINLNSYASWVGDCTPSCGPWTAFEIRDNLWAYSSDFGLFANGVEGTAALNARVGTGNHNGQSNTLLNHTTTGYPTGTFSEALISGFGFNDVANGDYKLTSGLYRAGQSRDATDDTDRGADITTLSTKIGASTNAYANASINAVTGNWAAAPAGNGGSRQLGTATKRGKAVIR